MVAAVAAAVEADVDVAVDVAAVVAAVAAAAQAVVLWGKKVFPSVASAARLNPAIAVSPSKPTHELISCTVL